MRTRLFCVWSVMAFIFATANTGLVMAEPGVDDGAVDEVATLTDGVVGRPIPIPANVPVRTHYVNASGDGGVASMTGELVFSNITGSGFMPPGLGKWMADDINTVAVGGCACSGYRFMVGGGGDGTGPGFTVSWKMYDACPGADGEIIPGSEGSLALPDDGLHLVEVDLVGSEVQTESGFWFAVMFDTWTAGWITGSPAFTGFTGDFYDWPYLRCTARFQGTTYYAGFYFESYCNDNPTKEFIAYYNPELSGSAQIVDVNQWIADPVELMIEDCELSSLEVGVRGGSGPFTLEVELWRQFCGPNYVIEGTQKTYEGYGTGSPELVRFVMLDEELNGIPLSTDTVWVAWKFNSSGCGVLIAEKPTLGEGQDLFALYDGDQCNYYWYGGVPFASFNATLKCIGEAPTGGCCDMTTAEWACYDDVPQIGCFGSALRRWERDVTCDPDAPDAFYPLCGSSACCLPNDSCGNMFEGECIAMHEPGHPEHPAVWERGEFCNVDGQRCLLFACRYAEGPCNIQHDEPGCNDPKCCDEVCTRDPFCCEWWWDAQCANKAEQYCSLPPPNDHCVDALALEEVDENPDPNVISLEESNAGATVGEDDPGFCCAIGGPETLGKSSIWFTFDALATSARVDTCTTTGGTGSGSDSLLAVFAGNCNALIPLGCNDDKEGCWTGGTNSRLELYNLFIGETYYVVLASKTEANDGPYRLRITFPSPYPDPPSNNTCARALSVFDGAFAFDLENATLDCPYPGCAPATGNDLWYTYTAIGPDLVSIETCDPGGGDSPETTLIVYSDNICPATPDRQVACNDDAVHCSPGSRVIFPNGSDRAFYTYKVRLGGEGDLDPSGTMTITRYDDCNHNNIPDICDIDCDADDGRCQMPGCGQVADCQPNGIPDSCDIEVGTSEDCQPDGIPDECGGGCEGCADGDVTFDDPVDGFIDALQPHPVSSTTPLQGIDTFHVTAPALAGDPTCWALCETANNTAVHLGIGLNDIAGITDNGDGTYTITLDRSIAHGEVTTLTYTSESGSTVVTGTFYYMPGDANADGTSAPADVLAVIDSLNGVTPLPDSQVDMDRDGTPAPADILRVIDLLNGANAFEPFVNVTIDPTGCP